LSFQGDEAFCGRKQLLLVSEVYNLEPWVFVPLDQRSRKRATLESSDWKSQNIGLPDELRMPSFQKRDPKNFFRPFLLFSKPIKIDPTTELSRVARFLKLA